MEVKPIKLYVHDELYGALCRVVPEAEIDDVYAEALWNVFFKKPFGEVLNKDFDFSRSVPVRFTPSLPTYLRWCGLIKEFIIPVINAFNDELWDIVIDYEHGLRGGK